MLNTELQGISALYNATIILGWVSENSQYKNNLKKDCFFIAPFSESGRSSLKQIFNGNSSNELAKYFPSNML